MLLGVGKTDSTPLPDTVIRLQALKQGPEPEGRVLVQEGIVPKGLSEKMSEPELGLETLT